MDATKKIKVLLILKGLKVTELAREIGVHQTAISHTIHGRLKSRRIQEFLAQKLGVPYRELWGEN